jgi:glycosyltransferase involved in cell wall biosynthesis
MRRYPKISVILATYNGKSTIDECLRLFFAQEYPRNQIEIIVADGGSIDGTLEILKKYKKKYPSVIKIIDNPKKYKIGAGGGADIAVRKASGDFILMIDQDNLLFQKSWLMEMVKILMENKDISCVQSLTFSPKKYSLTDRYLGMAGIEDPFAVSYSIKAQVIINPKHFKYDEKGKFYIYKIDKNDFYYGGDNGFLIRRKDLLENGGYTQDIDNFYRMALKEKGYKLAIPKNLAIFHKTSSGFIEFLKKRNYYVRHYLNSNIKNRDFYWISPNKNTLKQNLKFIKNLTYNLIVFPRIIEGIKMAIKKKDLVWLIHPLFTLSVTLGYIYSFILVKLLGKKD